MDELIARISAAIGVEAEVAELAAGHVLGFLQKAFPEGPAADLIINIPGAQEAMAAAAAPSLEGGLIGGLLGGLGGLVRGPQGEMFALAGRLGAAGLTKEQIQGLAKEIFDYAEQLIGKENLETTIALSAVPLALFRLPFFGERSWRGSAQPGQAQAEKAQSGE